jgi:putative DNA primase/helicase
MFPKEERDVTFREQVLMPELPGILNWALWGLMAYQDQGLNPPRHVENATREYRQEMDVIGQWLEERCIIDPTATTQSRELHENYRQWSGAEIGFAVSPKKFSQALIERGFKPVEKVLSSTMNRGLRLLF